MDKEVSMNENWIELITINEYDTKCVVNMELRIARPSFLRSNIEQIPN